VSLASGDDLAIHIAGATVDTQYRQLNVIGAVNLTDANLLLTSNFPGIVGNEVFTIVSATGPVTGTFMNFPLGTQVVIGTLFYKILYNSNNVQLVKAHSSVANRQVFYNRSTSNVFGNGAGNPINAIDSSKLALLPGQTTSYANYTNYVNGLNGIVVDIAGLTNTSTSDFLFATWNGATSNGFMALSIQPVITVISGGRSGGSTRVKIEFADNAIRNTWLRVTVLANANTGLTSNDVFYFGHAVADVNVGNSGSPIIVQSDSADTTAIRQNLSISNDSVSVSNIYDLNKDGRVNLTDLSIARQNQSMRLIRFFTAPISVQRSPTSELPRSSVGVIPILSNPGVAIDERPIDYGITSFNLGVSVSRSRATSVFRTFETISNSANSKAFLDKSITVEQPIEKIADIPTIDSFFIALGNSPGRRRAGIL